MDPAIGFAMRAATYGLIGFHMSEIGAAAIVLALQRTTGGEPLGLVLLLPAMACLAMAAHAVREVAQAFRAP